MLLNLQRRHSERCEGGHPAYSRSYETDERKRAWRKCYCPIYAGGTLGGAFRRKNTNATDWDEAKAVAAGWEQAGSWSAGTASVVPAPSVQSVAGDQGRFTIDHATMAYLANREGRSIAQATARKYRTLIKLIRAFAETRGYVMLDQFTVSDMDAFYLTWKDGVRARGKKLERLKGFFKFCVKRKMITENPAEDLQAPIGAGSAANKTPFTDAEIQRMFVACRRLGRVEWKNGSHTGEWSGDEVETFILLGVLHGSSHLGRSHFRHGATERQRLLLEDAQNGQAAVHLAAGRSGASHGVTGTNARSAALHDSGRFEPHGNCD